MKCQKAMLSRRIFWKAWSRLLLQQDVGAKADPSSATSTALPGVLPQGGKEKTPEDQTHSRETRRSYTGCPLQVKTLMKP
jgi:hypothetical protein